jgi:hypothetical protein
VPSTEGRNKLQFLSEFRKILRCASKICLGAMDNEKEE